MPHKPKAVRVDKLTRLIAVFDQFHGAVAAIDDRTVQRLVENWSKVREQCIAPGAPPRSALAAGMEQGLRELPQLLGSVRLESKKVASEALAAAVATYYPEFLARDATRLEKIRMRGSIRSESEYYLVRHRVDILEGEPSREEEVRSLYSLMDRFEARRA